MYLMEEEISATQGNQDNNRLEELNKTLRQAQDKCEEYLNGWKRAKADFINYQKDEHKRLENFAQFANEALLRNLIVVLDSFNLAIATAENPDKGLLIIRAQLEDMLKKYGLQPIPAKPGDPFLPEFHEAIAVADAPADAPQGTPNAIVEIIETGYTLNGKVVRPARVKINT